MLTADITSLAGNVQTVIKSPAGGIVEAVRLLRDGELVAFATETVYGLGGDAGSSEAIERIYAIKNRPADNPLIVHVYDPVQALSSAGKFTTVAWILAERFWPGPLTMVLPRGDGIASEVSAGLDTMAVRCPSHPVARLLLKEFAKPIAAPSANLSGRVSPTCAADVLAELGGKIPLILDGGVCQVGLESTVVDVTVDPPEVLRPGSITLAMLSEALCKTVTLQTERTIASAVVKSPGLLHRHYAPRTQTYRYDQHQWGDVLHWLSRQSEDFRVVQLCFDEHRVLPSPHRVIKLSSRADECARTLYAAMREADSFRFAVILIQMPVEHDEIWIAICDRMTRASEELPQ